MNSDDIHRRINNESPPDGKSDADRFSPKPGALSPASFPPPGQMARMAYSIREAAEILGVSEKSVRRLIDRRLLRPSRALRHLLIPKKEIERFLDETTVR